MAAGRLRLGCQGENRAAIERFLTFAPCEAYNLGEKDDGFFSEKLLTRETTMTRAARALSAKSSASAFTMVELIVVILVIVVLAVILTPTVMMAMDRAYSAKCMNNLSQIKLSLNNYCTANKDYLPYIGRDDPKVAPFQCMHRELGNVEILICPSDPTEGRGIVWTDRDLGEFLHPDVSQCSYTWTRDAVELPTKSVNVIEPRTLGLVADGTLVVTDRHEGWKSVQPQFDKKDRKSANQWVHQQHYVNFLYADGHVDKVDIKDMPKMRTDPRTPEEKVE